MGVRYGKPWQRVRQQVLAESAMRNGGTARCEIRLPGCTDEATAVDHIVSLIERPDLELVRSNMQPACKHCNSAKEIRRRHRPPRRKW